MPSDAADRNGGQDTSVGPRSDFQTADAEKRIHMATADTELGSSRSPADSAGTLHAKNPRRVAAGRCNWAKRGPLTEAGRERLRLAALESRPWQFSTGPKTPTGKAKSAANGRLRQKGPISIRQLRKEMVDLKRLLLDLQETRNLVGA